MKETKNEITEITLKPKTEIFDKAKEIAKMSKGKIKTAYIVWYWTYARAHLLSVMQTMECEIHGETPWSNQIYVSMCPEQLKAIKSMDCIERVAVNTEAEIGATVLEPTLTSQKEYGIMKLHVESEETEERALSDDGIALACYNDGTSSDCTLSDCSGNCSDCTSGDCTDCGNCTAGNCNHNTATTAKSFN